MFFSYRNIVSYIETSQILQNVVISLSSTRDNSREPLSRQPGVGRGEVIEDGMAQVKELDVERAKDHDVLSIVKVFRIVEALAKAGERGVTELSRELDINKTTISSS